MPGRTWGASRKTAAFRVRDSHPLWWDFPVAFHYDSLCSLCRFYTTPAPQPLAFCKTRFRLVPVRSPLLGESRLISFPSGTEMFHFPRSPRSRDAWVLPHAGCPIRVSAALRLLNGSPQLFAAHHALHRSSAPRHPPHALRSLPFVSLPRRATTCLHPLAFLLTFLCQRTASL